MNQTPIQNRMNRSTCRACGSKNLILYLPLGDQALANAFLSPQDVNKPEPKFPLEVFYCGDCFHSQLGYTVNPDVMFRNYLYVSGTSDAIRKHFAEYAREVFDRFMKPGDLVIEVASNDGTLLKNFIPWGAKVLGIEPAENIAKMANEDGVLTIPEWHTVEVAKKVVAEHGKAKSIIANNVFAHVDNIHEFAEASRELLADDGVWTIESPHVLHMLQHNEFDTVYHEHIAYLSLYALIPFFKSHGLNLFDVQPTWVHGGSNRMYISKDMSLPHSDKLKEILQAEIDFGINKPETYQKFRERVEQVKIDLLKLLADLKAQGKTIAGYGAAAKGQTLVQYFGIGTETLKWIADKSPLKQHRLSPGLHIPIVSPDLINTDTPDYLLILAWNFADEIMRQQADFAAKGGKFIIPIPSPRIV